MFWGNHLDGSEERDFSGGENREGRGVAVVLATDAGGPLQGGTEGEEGDERVRRNSAGGHSHPGWDNWADVLWGTPENICPVVPARM